MTQYLTADNVQVHPGDTVYYADGLSQIPVSPWLVSDGGFPRTCFSTESAAIAHLITEAEAYLTRLRALAAKIEGAK